MGLLDVNLSPDERTLRGFGFIAFAAFGALAVSAYYQVGPFSFDLATARLPVAASLASVGTASVVLSLAYPRANRPLFVTLTLITFPIGVVLSYAILSALFFLLITPVGSISRAVGYNPLALRIDRSAKSYWTSAKRTRSRRRYFAQF